MEEVYYIEINIICIVILLLFRKMFKGYSNRVLYENRIFDGIIITTLVMCFADIAARLVSGDMFYGSRVISLIAHTVYIEGLAAAGYLWLMYVRASLMGVTNFDKQSKLGIIPLLIFTAIAVTNPITKWMFIIDENNIYSRNWCIYIQWAIIWVYFLTAMIKIIGVIKKEKSLLRRREYMPFAYFIVAPAIGCIMQMQYYWLVTVQVGIMVSIAMMFIFDTRAYILRDALTGIGNRAAFNSYIENYFSYADKKPLTVLMMDVNGFKKINDTYGHMNGDRALVETAKILKRVCEKTKKYLFLCRSGGDEFIIGGSDLSEEEADKLKEYIKNEIAESNKNESRPYKLSLSIGTARGFCETWKEVERLIHVADENMYSVKHSRSGSSFTAEMERAVEYMALEPEE